MGPSAAFPADTDIAQYLKEGSNEHDLGVQLSAYCEQIGCEVIDTEARMAGAARNGRLVYSTRYDTYLDVEGHEIIAELVVERLSAG